MAEAITQYWQENGPGSRAVAAKRLRMLFLPLAILASYSANAVDELWVENPQEISFSVADMTANAEAMGLTNAALTAGLREMLSNAGLKANRTDTQHAGDVLFLDVIVEEETFYASVGFWRMANYRLPNGEVKAEMVTVWQDYSVGSHHHNPEIVRATVSRIVQGFITKYSDANDVDKIRQVAATP